ncbi:hypothetical protein FB45DRAFT_1061826 [Roridomyces roridus]|uniref:BRCT domain-containing protein n=1 Tax=Roridomyces roridus TaxID=1738132 RepID=A0AAD7BIM9_9AGAR|nr:hypothetical protein FB45DRAFT_1061826 [Roridomyces roridus]
MQTPPEQIFTGIRYQIQLDGGSTSTSTALSLRRLLEEHGAKEAEYSSKATRIITDTNDTESMRAPCGVAFESFVSGVLVTAEWVYSSIEAGVKRPSQLYSPAPVLLLSSVVMSPHPVTGLSKSWSRILQPSLEMLGGEWLETPTAQTTHYISESASECANPNLVIVTPKSFLEIVTRRERLPHPPHCVVDGQSVSRAHYFCHALLARTADSNLKTEAHVASVLTLPYLPYEVVAEIFLTYKQNCLATPGLSFVRSLLKLTHICGRWRLIAHYTAELWTDLHLDVHAKRPYRRLQNIVREWVERSSPRALSVYVRSIYSRTHNPIIDFILAHSSRIRALHLELPEEHLLPLLQKPRRSRPYMRYRYANDDGPQIIWCGIRKPITVFQNSPRLRTFCIDARGIFNPALLRLTSWSNLTDIDFGSVPLGVLDAASLLPMFTKSKRLILDMDSRQGSFMPPVGRATLPIEEFEWHGYPAVDDASALAPLVLQRLTSLQMRNGAEASLLALHSRSAFKLQNLKLTFFRLTYPGFSPFLRDMSSLTILELYQCISITDDLLEFLVNDPDKRVVLPRMEQLVIATHHPQFSEALMIRMIESRWLRTPLVKARLTLSEMIVGQPEHREVLDWAVRIVEAGLELDYH